MGYWKYKQEMLDRFMVFRKRNFLERDELFYERYNHVFKPEFAEYNLFKTELDKLLPRKRRHRWYGNMGSSQALAVSVFGTIMKRGDLGLLAEICEDDGSPLLLNLDREGHPEFDYPISALNEPTPTSIDIFLPGRMRNVALECKLWEDKLGPCSQVDRKKCNGNYEKQKGRKQDERCYLTGRGVEYWNYIPQLFRWRADVDHFPCPILEPYQLVRNVLAVAISPDTKQIRGESITILVYDDRNPVFTSGGKADTLFRVVQEALDRPTSLKRITWQLIATTLSKRGGYDDFLAWLDEKYGIYPKN